MARQLTQEEFLEKARPVCEGKVGLSKFVYTKSSVKSTATCLVSKDHPDFEINPNKLLSGVGCPACAGNSPKTLEKVYEEIRLVHGDKYSLTDSSVYRGTNHKLDLFCNDCQEVFSISPKKCKSGQGHRKCAREQSAIGRTKTFEDLLRRSEEIFGPNVFLYDEATYTNWNSPMKIGCRVHGDFWNTPVNHFNTRYGCPSCWEVARGREVQRKYSDTFVNMAKEVHGDCYDYSGFVYENAKTKGQITCSKHGVFEMTPDVHLSGCGCPSCAHTFSKPQEEISRFIESLGFEILRNFTLEDNTELDILIPELNLAIEYNGLRWHSDLFKRPTFHLRKTQVALQQGIRLVHLFEDEWLFKRGLVESWLKVLVGKETFKVDARKCSFSEVTWLQYKEFVNQHHLQGAGAAPSFMFGLFCEGELVAAMGFSSRDCSSGMIELVRFCSKGVVRGGFSKLLHNSLKNMPKFCKVVSFSDTRWSQGDVYRKNGFSMAKVIKPDYWYVNRSVREDKRNYQRSYLPTRLKEFDPALSERLNCANNGIYRIFDCGKIRWELDL